MTVRPARLPRALAASALVLLLPLAGCAGTDASDDAAGTTSSGSSAPAGASSSASEEAPAETPQVAPTPVEIGQRIEVQVAGGQVTGDTGRVPVAVGTTLMLVITTDVADEVHVHGYDLTAELEPGTETAITVDATIPGVFEVELHESGTALLSLQVS